MKKIIAFVMSLLVIIFVTGCNQSNQIKASHMSETLNQELEEYFKIDDELTELEPPSSLSIDYFIKNYNNSKKYIISIDNNYKAKYFCAYLDNSIKDTLDSIEISEPDGDPSWYIWQGENRYLKKYEYAIKKNIIDVNEYCMNWVEFEKKKDIIDSYDNFFLVCIAKSIKFNAINYENNEKLDKVVFIEEQASSSWWFLKEDKSFFILLDNRRNDLLNLTTLQMYYVLMFYSFEYKKIDENIYINLNSIGPIVEYNLHNYKIIDESYFYLLDDVMDLIKEQK